MPVRVVVDIPALSERIKEISKTYEEGSQSNNVGREGNPSNLLRGLIRSIIMTTIAEDKSYWGRAGIRMVPSKEFQSCLAEVKGSAKVLGEGEFGKFISVNADSCIKGLPSGLTTVGIKTEYIKDYYQPSQTPEGVRDATKIAKRAAKLGVGPELYDVFVTKDSKGMVMIVKVSQIVDGKTWENIEWESPEKLHAAAGLDSEDE